MKRKSCMRRKLKTHIRRFCQPQVASRQLSIGQSQEAGEGGKMEGESV
ncbi:MAG: hypothetical protein Q8P34_10315 [Bacteroidota bacterium]|nr:hypothetical protein [Bacteroidota bacterium]